ncbi:hypothetical protein HMI54_005692 [Coelomomyces lativittatus]|nr:hypothetical protein HMI55_001930 [Coelomomyces lativittatus]KAJ1505719.1 hypothetical protein HMI54_005692 [Coelomomyces lativittatus]KAJ1511635.1 hypothetical protein HMI56_005145 [Coelomomyces lativittatus]
MSPLTDLTRRSMNSFTTPVYFVKRQHSEMDHGNHNVPSQTSPSPSSSMDTSALGKASPSSGTSTASTSGGHDHGSSDLPMRMYFHNDVNDLLLFEGWVTSTPLTYGLAVLGVCVFAMGYALFLYQFKPWCSRKCSVQASMTWKARESRQCGYSLVHAIELSYSLLLMLIVMTFNLGWCLAVIGGVALGTFLFRRGPLYHVERGEMMDSRITSLSARTLAKDPRETGDGLCC